MKIAVIATLIFVSALTVAAQDKYNKCNHCFVATDLLRYRGQVAVDLKSINTDLLRWYKYWEKNYVVYDGPGKAYIKNDEQKEEQPGLTTSEAMGYGMLIEVLMADGNAGAHKNFDALYTYALAHHIYHVKDKGGLQGFDSPNLMVWNVMPPGSEQYNDSATDGDLDIAYALIMASKQWSNGKYNYADCARKTLKEIIRCEVDVPNKKLERGSADQFNTTDPGHNFIRISDFMPTNFRAFAAFSDDAVFWNDFITANYNRYEAVQQQESPQLGFFPEYIYESAPGHFFVITNATRRLAAHQHLDDGGGKDNPLGAWLGYNSCRLAWRIGLDYLLTSDTAAKHIMDRLNTGIHFYTGNDLCNMTNVLKLRFDGDVKKLQRKATGIAGKNSADLSMIAPLSVMAMAYPNSAWKTRLGRIMTDNPDKGYLCSNAGPELIKDRDYYDRALRLLCAIIVTQHYWTPTK
jgi:endo-1,4-beta-D-glucanase Y